MRPVPVLLTAAVVAQTFAHPVRAQVPSSPQPVVAFVDVAVVPMDSERILPHQTVLVRDGRIAALGATERIDVPAHALRIDGRGKYLLPGLADMHTHISRYSSSSIHRALLLLLANGVTTIRDVEFAPKSTALLRSSLEAVEPQRAQIDGPGMLRLRADIRAGRRWGPRMYLASAWHRDSTKSIAQNVAAYQTAGFDFIKIYLESPATRDTLIPVAHRLGVSLVAHGLDGDFPGTRKWGLKSIEHFVPYLNPADSLRLPEFIAATIHDSIWNCPGRAPYAMTAPGPLERRYGLAEWRLALGQEPDTELARKTLMPDTSGAGAMEYPDRVLKALSDAGAGLLTGTDMGWFLQPPGFTLHRALQNFVHAGLTPYQALRASTWNVAQYFGTRDSAGTVAVGKWADLVLVDGNPLHDIRNAAEIRGVMIGGRWLDRAAIERRLDRQYRGVMRRLPPGVELYRHRAPELLGGSSMRPTRW